MISHQRLPRTHLHLCHLSAVEAIPPQLINGAAIAMARAAMAQETSLRCLLNGEAMTWTDLVHADVTNSAVFSGSHIV